MQEREEKRECEFGVPRKSGREVVSAEAWAKMDMFIRSRLWYVHELLDQQDKEDPLLVELPRAPDGSLLGAFMMGFDFHLTESGPKLIEINTNAGGLATVLSFPGEHVQNLLKLKFVGAIREEFQRFRGPEAVLGTVAIVDDDARHQKMFAETSHFAALLKSVGIDARVCSPEEIRLNKDNALEFALDGVSIDFVYNRMCDFVLREERHAHIRASAVAKGVVMSPHPALYVRAGDKRRLIELSKGSAKELEVVPKTFLFRDKDLAYWQENKKQFVFKPAQSFGSRGVYRGASISRNKIATLPLDTIVQEDCSPPVSLDDGTKFDVRIYTSDIQLLGMASRHFELSIMEMKSQKSGFKEALPDGVCCFPMITDADTMTMISKLSQEWSDEGAKKVATSIAKLCHCDASGKSTWSSEKACCDEIVEYLNKLRGESK